LGAEQERRGLAAGAGSRHRARLMVSALDGAESLIGMVHEDLRCKVDIGGLDADAVKVSSLDGIEGLSRLFSYTVVVATEAADVAKLEKALGSDVSITVSRESAVERVVHGIVTEVIPDGTYVGKRQMRTTLVVEPRLSNLAYCGGFRMFQNQTMRQIVEELLKPERVEAVWRVRPEPPKREYRTQYDESDLDFMRRLASDEGLHFFFEHTSDKTTLVFTNSPKGFTELDGESTFDFRDTEGAVTGEHVRSIRRAQRIRTGAVEHRDYDFELPRTALFARAETEDPQSEANTKRRERRDYPGEFTDADKEGTPRAQMRLEELRSDASVLMGTASTVRLLVGKQFTLEGHRDKAFNRKLLITEVSVGASIQGALWEQSDGSRGARAGGTLSRFAAVPAETPLRPPRRRKPSGRLQTARVVGPKEGDPFVDEFGRIKVQFAWDRDGTFDEHSSCFIRMMTPVAHEDEGFYSAHKVGSEVLVDFIDGDIDRPIVLGAVYNGRERQPYGQPDQVSRSSWKVRSIPGGKGFNEITFENQAGKEQIILHAQKDRNETILHDHTETIGANQTTTVGANQTISVGANQTISVTGNRALTIDKNDTIAVKGARTETVDASETVTVKSGRTHTVQTGDEALTVAAGSRAVTVSKEDKLTADSKIDAIATTFDLNVGTSITIHHQSDSTLTLREGEASLNTAKKIVVSNDSSGTITMDGGVVTITAKDELVLGSGAAKISLKKDGTVTIEAATEIGIACKSSSVKLEPAQAVINGTAVNVTASGMMEISGALIKIN
jgi:type VI secretion system secreted protein VgrG